MFGGKDDELATRWVQLGVFSPILRLHSGLSPFNTKEPWRFGAAGPGRDDRLPPAAAPAAALPAHDEPPRRARGRAAGAADVLVAPGRRRGVRGAEPVHLRHRSCWSRRSPPRRTRALQLGERAGLAAAGHLDRRPHRPGVRRRPADDAAPRPGRHPGAGRGRCDRAAGRPSRCRGTRPDNPARSRCWWWSGPTARSS